MASDNLEELRREIDDINFSLLDLLNQRAKIAQKVGQAKRGQNIYRPSREAEILRKIAAANQGPLPNSSLEAIFAEVISACRNLERKTRVAYLGPEGTYCEEAARKKLGSSCDFIACESFAAAARAAENGETDVAVVAIENSSEGSIGVTHDLLLETPLKICGEIALPIHHQLLSRSSNTSKITEVFAHPQALGQCRDWLAANLPNVLQTTVKSNGEAAKLAAANSTTAAIASRRAAEIYGLNTLAKNIEDEKSNTTRFLVLGQTSPTPSDHDKTSVICSTPNKPGAFLQILEILAKNDISMTRLESRPSKNHLGEYIFFVDFLGHECDKKVSCALNSIRKIAAFVKVLGSYLTAR